jgi:UDPglucose--hexose-1-phosphate uridylyltransferase
VTLWCPYASSGPYQLRLAHDDAGARFDLADAEVIKTTAVALRDALHRLRDVLGDVPYNMVVHTAPRGSDGGVREQAAARRQASTPAVFATR